MLVKIYIFNINKHLTCQLTLSWSDALRKLSHSSPKHQSSKITGEDGPRMYNHKGSYSSFMHLFCIVWVDCSVKSAESYIVT